MRRLPLGPLLLVALALLAPPHAGAQGEPPAPAHVLRLGTLLPQSRMARQGLTLWNRRLAELTEGRLSVRVYWGGAMGDERTMVRRMRIGSLDGASLTSNGLAQIHRPVLVLQAPGVFTTYEQLDAVRRELGPELARGVEAEGFGLLGFGDAGRVRLFSRGEPIRRPSDLRHRRPWVPREDAVFREVLAVVGANGVPLSVGEVFAGLRTRMIDVVPGTALAAAGLQWFTSLDHATAQSDGFLVGGMVVRGGFLDALSAEDREALFLSARENHERLLRGVRAGDERALAALGRRGLSLTDVDAHRAEWVRVAAETRQRLAGRVFPAALLERVERIAADAR